MTDRELLELAAKAAQLEGEPLWDDAELAKPATMQLCLNPHWKYTRSEETDVTRTWRRAGWFPVMAHRRPA